MIIVNLIKVSFGIEVVKDRKDRSGGGSFSHICRG